MLIPVSELINVYQVKPSGVLHVGAHKGEESSEYKKHAWGKVVWVEAQPDLARYLRNLFQGSDNIVIEAAVWHESGVELEFNIASNGESSSLLEFGSHGESYPHIKFVDSITVTTRRLDEIVPANEFPDFLNLDIQGAELNALMGLGSRLKEFSWVYTEVNDSEVYIGCTLIKDLDIFLAENGFKRLTTRWVPGKGWGDALYVNRNIRFNFNQRSVIVWNNLNWQLGQIRDELGLRQRLRNMCKWF